MFVVGFALVVEQSLVCNDEYNLLCRSTQLYCPKKGIRYILSITGKRADWR